MKSKQLNKKKNDEQLFSSEAWKLAREEVKAASFFTASIVFQEQVEKLALDDITDDIKEKIKEEWMDLGRFPKNQALSSCFAVMEIHP